MYSENPAFNAGLSGYKKIINRKKANCMLLAACQSLTYQEQRQLTELRYKGVTIDTPVGDWEKPASPLTAGLLNLLPGIGNFYLGNGQAAQSEQNIYGLLNLLTWPLSILWGVPEAAIDANSINKRDLLMYYMYDERGRRFYQNLR